MHIFLSSETYNRILLSLAVQIKLQYPSVLPSLLGFGASGEELVAALASKLDSDNVQKYRCDVIRKAGKIAEILDFPNKDLIKNKLLICDTIIDSGKTMEAVVKHAWTNGVNDVKTLSIAVRNGSGVIPNFYALMVEENDVIYFPTLHEYPTVTLEKGLIRVPRVEDLSQKFVCGNPETDNLVMSEYIEDQKKGYMTYILEDRGCVLGLLHFFCCEGEEVEVEILATAKSVQSQEYSQMLFEFLNDWCKFNKKRYIKMIAGNRNLSFLKNWRFNLQGKEKEPDSATFKVY